MTTVSAGTLALGNTIALATSTLDTGASGAQAVTFTAAGTNTYRLGGLTGADALAIGGNTIRVGVFTNASTTYSGILSGTGALIKDGTGTLTLSGDNSYSGATAINGGILEVTANNALGTNAAGTSVTNGAALKLTNVNYSTAEALSLNGTGIANGGALVNSGTSTFAGQVTAATSASINAGGGTLTLTGGLVKNGTTATIMGGGRVNITGTGISGASASSDLVVDGTTVVVSATSNYNGPTTVQNSGTFVANAAITTTAVTVSSNSTLSGTGSVTAAAGNFIYMNGTLQVGDSTVVGFPVVSSLQITTSGGGAIQLGANSLLAFDLFTGAGLGDNTGDSNAADRLILLGMLDATLGGKLVIGNGGNPTPLTGFMQGDSWKLIDLSGGGSITGTLLLDYSALNLTPGLAASFDNTTGVLSIVIPEPSRALLLMLGLMGVVGRRRRKL